MKVIEKLKRSAVFLFLFSLMMFLFNKIVYFLATVDNLLFHPKEHYYNWQYGDVFYTKQGNGDALLLIHDLSPSGSACEWNNVIDSLSSTHTVYTLDLLGCGRSSKPSITYTNYFFVQLIDDFIKNVICNPVDLVVSGSSSEIGIMASRNDDTMLRKLILINPKDLVSSTKIPTIFSKIKKHIICCPIIGTFIYNILSSQKVLEKQFMLHYFYNPADISRLYIRTCYESSHTNNNRGKYLYASIVGRYTTVSTLQALEDSNTPIFILIGSCDPLYRLIADQYVTYNSSVEILTIENAKFLPQIENPAEFTSIIDILCEG
ncbi:MAG: alpha/beta fold hydrolase [Lachnospiraceae bacterium]